MSQIKVHSILDDFIGQVKLLGVPSRFTINRPRRIVTANLQKGPIDFDMTEVADRYFEKMEYFIKQSFHGSTVSYVD